MKSIDTDAVAFVLLDKLVPGVGKFVRADTNEISWIQIPCAYTLRIDIDTVGTAQINDTIAPGTALLHPRMIARNLWMIEDDGVVIETPNGQSR